MWPKLQAQGNPVKEQWASESWVVLPCNRVSSLCDVIMILGTGDWVCFIQILHMSYVDKFLKSKAPFLHLHSNHIRRTKIFNSENVSGAEGLLFVDDVVFLRIRWHWCLSQHVICEIKWIFLQLNDFPLGGVLVQQSHCQMVFMGYLCKW